MVTTYVICDKCGKEIKGPVEHLRFHGGNPPIGIDFCINCGLQMLALTGIGQSKEATNNDNKPDEVKTIPFST